MKSKTEVSEQINNTHSSVLSFSGLAETLFYSNLPVGFCTASAAAMSFKINNSSVSIPAILFIFCSTVFIYNLERIYSSPADTLNSPQRSLWIQENRALLSNLNIILISICTVLLAIRSSTAVFGAAFFLLLSCICYKSRLKRIPAMKNLMVAGIWTVTVSIFPLMWADLSLNSMNIHYACLCFGCALMNTVLFDIRDLTGDKACGIKSIPVILSRKACRLFLIILGAAIIGFSVYFNHSVMGLIPLIYLLLFLSEESKVKYLIADLSLALPFFLS